MRWRCSAGARRSPPYGCSIDRCCAAPARQTYFISISSQEAGNNLQINCHFYKAAAAGCTRSPVKDDVEAEKDSTHPAGHSLSVWNLFSILVFNCEGIFFLFLALCLLLFFEYLNIVLLKVFASNLHHFRHILSENICDLSLGMTSHHYRQQMQPSHFNGLVAGVQKNKIIIK